MVHFNSVLAHEAVSSLAMPEYSARVAAWLKGILRPLQPLALPLMKAFWPQMQVNISNLKFLLQVCGKLCKMAFQIF
jgi:hypothetical protein